MEEILHQLIGSLSHYLQDFIHSRWLFGISAINSIIKCSCPFRQKPSSRKVEKLRKPKDFNERTVEVPKFVKEAMKDETRNGLLQCFPSPKSLMVGWFIHTKKTAGLHRPWRSWGRLVMVGWLDIVYRDLQPWNEQMEWVGCDKCKVSTWFSTVSWLQDSKNIQLMAACRRTLQSLGQLDDGGNVLGPPGFLSK